MLFTDTCCMLHDGYVGKTASQGIPSALAVPVVEGLGTIHAQLIQKHRILYYWFWPEDTFLYLKPSRVIVPEHRPEAWAKGDFRTDSSKMYVAKLGSSRLRISAPRVRAFVQKMKLNEAQTLQVMPIGFNARGKIPEMRSGSMRRKVLVSGSRPTVTFGRLGYPWPPTALQDLA